MNKTLTLSVLVAAMFAGNAMATPITPSNGSFGTLAGATFGGSGIPNTAVAIDTVIPSGGDGVTPHLTLGLTAHYRYPGLNVPNLTNNGAGIFYATPGVSTALPSPADPYATWNFAFYLGGDGLSQYSYNLFYDFDPSVDTAASAHGLISIPKGALSSTLNPSQGSWNLGMDFLDIAGTGLVPPPNFGAFDPNSSGEYSFALVAYGVDQEANTFEVARSAIVVKVSSPAAIPEPASLALLGLGLISLVAMRRKS